MPLSDRAVLAAFVSVYIAVDIAYVVASRGTYESVARAISGSGFPAMTGTRAAGAIAAYAAMAFSWLAFVPLATRAWAPAFGGRLALSGAAAGAALACAIYVVFNGTLHATFAGWTARVALRDTLWGVSWLAALSAAYGAVAGSRASRA
jgi:uncharacterized membrane protein